MDAYHVFTQDGETYLGVKYLYAREAAQERRRGYQLFRVGTI